MSGEQHPSHKAPWVLHRLASCDSTQRQARALIQTLAAEAGEPHPTSGHPLVVYSFQQDEGYGQRGRTWLQAQVGLALTLAWPIAREQPPLPWPLWLASCLMGVLDRRLDRDGHEGLLGHGHARLSVKWPNDLLLGNRKLAGVLVEQLPDPRLPERRWCLAGLGLNGRTQPGLLVPSASGPGSIPGLPPVGLLDHRPDWSDEQVRADLEGVLQDLLQAMAPALGPDGPDPTWRAHQLARAQSRLAYQDQPVVLVGPSGEQAGQGLTLAADGSLWLKTPEGPVQAHQGQLSLRPVQTRLLVDLGNTRLKWQLVRADGSASRAERTLASGTVDGPWLAGLPGADAPAWTPLLQALTPMMLGQVRPMPWVCSVAGPAETQSLLDLLQGWTGQLAHQLRPPAQAVSPIQIHARQTADQGLGADRWAALMGLADLLIEEGAVDRLLRPQRMALVHAGTATVTEALLLTPRDLAGAAQLSLLEGQIYPGWSLMIRALAQGTGRLGPGLAALEAHQLEQRSAFLPREPGTARALTAGIAAAQVGPLLAWTSPPDRIVVTGGARSEWIRCWVQFRPEASRAIPVVGVADLVLRGLGAFAESCPASPS